MRADFENRGMAILRLRVARLGQDIDGEVRRTVVYKRTAIIQVLFVSPETGRGPRLHWLRQRVRCRKPRVCHRIAGRPDLIRDRRQANAPDEQVLEDPAGNLIARFKASHFIYPSIHVNGRLQSCKRYPISTQRTCAPRWIRQIQVSLIFLKISS